MTDFATLISNLGFPIACVVALSYYIVTTQKGLQNSIDRNNIILSELKELIEHVFKGGNDEG